MIGHKEERQLQINKTQVFSAAASHGFLVAFERTLWVESGVLVATAALVFLLPMRAREEIAA